MAGRKPHQSIQIFKNPYLEKLTHVHPITPLLVWTPVIAYLLWRSFNVEGLSGTSIAAIGVVALVVWTLAEYVLHRFVFHFEARGPISERLQFLIHGLHHDDPIDPTRLVMPPAAGIALGGLLYGIFRAFLGPVWVQPFFAFFLVGYLCYDYIHFAIHHFTPRTPIGKFLKQSHMLHHYAAPETRWGVSTPLWDIVFGTMEEEPKRVRHGS